MGMTKAEQEWGLIEALVYCKGKRLTKKSCAGCPYAGAGCAIDATIAKLRAQEPVEPIRKVIGCGWVLYRCGKCGNSIVFYQRFCTECGQAVKWE